MTSTTLKTTAALLVFLGGFAVMVLEVIGVIASRRAVDGVRS